jgi:membrane-bound lytic murein transglycosylase B
VFPVFAESRACPLEALESSMSFPILEHVAKTARHTTLFLSCGAAKATAGTVHFLVFAVVALFVFGAGSARAADCDDSAEGFNEWLNSFKQVAMSNGVSREVVDAALNGVTYDASVKAHDHGVAMFGHNFAGFAASCPSSDDLRQFAGFRKGGSGSSVV